VWWWERGGDVSLPPINKFTVYFVDKFGHDLLQKIVTVVFAILLPAKF
jgi:hypothetical protein